MASAPLGRPAAWSLATDAVITLLITFSAEAPGSTLYTPRTIRPSSRFLGSALATSVLAQSGTPSASRSAVSAAWRICSTGMQVLLPFSSAQVALASRESTPSLTVPSGWVMSCSW